MVDWTNWVNWNAGTALLYTLIALTLWVVVEVSKSDPALKKIKHPKLLGIAVSLISCFELGLYAIVPMFNFLLISYVLEYWLYKYNSKSQKDKRKSEQEVVENFN